MPTTATTIVSEMTEATEQLMSIVSMLRSRDTLADAIVDVDIAAEAIGVHGHQRHRVPDGRGTQYPTHNKQADWQSPRTHSPSSSP